MPRKRRRLPPDPEQQNRDRSGWAMAAVETFQAATRLSKADGLDTAIMDLIGDLAHLCDDEGLNLAGLITRAKFHYDQETDFLGKQFEGEGE